MHQIPGYDDYWITECGTVTSKKHGKARELRVTKDRSSSYGYVRLSVRGKSYKWKVHRLVAFTFLGASGLAVLHIDGNPDNNCVSNLRYGTQSENMIDSSIHGTHNSRKLTDDEVRSIRNQIGSYREIGNKYSVNPGAIFAIKTGRTYTHIE